MFCKSALLCISYFESSIVHVWGLEAAIIKREVIESYVLHLIIRFFVLKAADKQQMCFQIAFCFNLFLQNDESCYL